MSVVEFSNVSLSMPRTKRRQGSGRKHRLLRIAGETSRSMIPVLENVSFTINRGIPSRSSVANRYYALHSPDWPRVH